MPDTTPVHSRETTISDADKARTARLKNKQKQCSADWADDDLPPSPAETRGMWKGSQDGLHALRAPRNKRTKKSPWPDHDLPPAPPVQNTSPIRGRWRDGE